MATWSLVSTAPVVVGPLGNIDEYSDSTFTPVGFFQIKIAQGATGLTITKASSLGGTQSALSFPISLDQARDLATALIKIVT